MNKIEKDEHLKLLLEEELRYLISNLKPELKEKAVFIVDTKEDVEGNASCNYLTDPPTVCFNLCPIHSAIRRYLEEILSHEMIHVIQGRGDMSLDVREKDAYRNQGKKKFFNFKLW